LTRDEGRAVLRSQIGTLEPEAENRSRHSKSAPCVFTEWGVAMLSTVLDSAILANISIVRTFVRIRQAQIDNTELDEGLNQLEWQQSEQGEQIRMVFETVDNLTDYPWEAERKTIGFSTSQTLLLIGQR
jgi:hypothetical protein